MANGFFSEGLKHWGRGEIAWKSTGGSNIQVALVDTADYTVNLITHEFRSSVPLIGQEEVSGNMSLIDVASDFVVDANDVTFTGTTGDQCEGVLVFQNTGSLGTDVLLFWWDTAPGLPVILGGDVTITWDNGPSKIARV